MVWLGYQRAWGGLFENRCFTKNLDNFEVSAELLQPIRFQGQFFDPENRLHYNRFRYYDYDVGMFIQRDPIGLNGGMNVFQYAPNPVQWIDPLGLAADNAPLTKQNCRALVNIINHEETYGKFSVIANYTINFSDNAAALDRAFPSLGGLVSIDWMMRSSLFGAGTVPGANYLVYVGGKMLWNSINLINPLKNIDGEANSNAPHALNAWYYNSDMTLRKMFAPSLEICRKLCDKCTQAMWDL